VRLLVAKRKMAGTEPKGDTQKTINTTSPPRRAVPLARLTCRLRLLRRNFVQDASKTIALITLQLVASCNCNCNNRHILCGTPRATHPQHENKE